MSKKFELFAEDGVSMRNYWGFIYEDLKEAIEHRHGECDFGEFGESEETTVYIQATGKMCRLVCHGPTGA